MRWQQGHFATSSGDLYYQRWRQGQGPMVLALHGWLDNSASFRLLAEQMPEYDLIALDLPGHGRSAHDPRGFYHLWEYLPALIEVVEALGQPVHLWGHSMGGMVAPLLAMAEPERILSLVLIDSLGGPPYGSRDLLLWLSQCRQRPKAHLPYDQFADMVSVRMRGMTPLSQQASALLCAHQADQQADGRWLWTFDPAIKLGSPVRLRDDDYHLVLSQLPMPTLVMLAKNGWVQQFLDVEQRLGWLNDQSKVRWVDGGHHCHLEHDQVADCINVIREFYE